MVSAPIDRFTKAQFVTLTFPIGKYRQQHYETLRNVLKYLNKCGTYQLVCEIGETGNFHYHYIINVKDKVKHSIFMNYWQSHYGYVKIKPVTDYLGCFIYLRKMSNEFPQDLYKDDDIYKKVITNSTYPTVLKWYLTKEQHKKTVKKYNEVKGSLDSYFKNLTPSAGRNEFHALVWN